MFYTTFSAKPLSDPRPGDELTYKNNFTTVSNVLRLSKLYSVFQPLRTCLPSRTTKIPPKQYNYMIITNVRATYCIYNRTKQHKHDDL